MKHRFSRSSRAKSSARAEEMIAMVSHDLRAPLTSIQFSLELLALELQKGCSEEALEEVSVAQRNASRVMDMVNQLLNAQQVRNQSLSICRRRIRLSTIAEQAVECVLPTAKSKSISVENLVLRLQSENDLPGLVEVDGDRLLQVMVNLMSNAIKFSPNGSVISISAKRIGETIEIMVQDDGPGVPVNMRKRIFERFVRAQDVSTEGVGLGLAICREIVEQHGGMIGCRPGQTGGSIFWFRIPIQAPISAEKIIKFPGVRMAKLAPANVVNS